MFNPPKKQHNCEETVAAFLQAIQSSEHFQNSVKRNSEPHPEIDSVIAFLPSLPKDDAVRTFVSLLKLQDHHLVVRRLRAVEKTASPQTAEALAKLVAVTADQLREGGLEEFGQARIFVPEILRRITDEMKRGEIGSAIISESPSLLFVCALMKWAAGSMTIQPLFAAETERRLKQELADRIERHLAGQATPVYLSEGEKADAYFGALVIAGRAERLRTYLTDALTSRPESISEFLWVMFPGRGRDVITGEICLIRIIPQGYRYVSQLIDLDFVADLVQKKYKTFPSIATVPGSDSEWDAAHAQQFLNYHHAIVRKENPEE